MRFIIIIALFTLVLSGCGKRDNEISYLMAVQEGWQTVDVQPYNGVGMLDAEGIRVTKINHVSGDSAEYIMQGDGVSGYTYTWIKKPFTFWDKDLAIVRAFSSSPEIKRTFLQKIHNVDSHGNSLDR